MDRTYLDSFTVPANTLQGSPAQDILSLEDAHLKRIVVTVPDGHVGLTGFRILQSHQQIFPWSNNQYLVANNRTITVDYDDYITVSGLTFQGFNNDVFDHTFYCEVTISDITTPNGGIPPGQSAPVILPVSTSAPLDPLSPDALIASLPGGIDVSGDLLPAGF